MSNSPQVVPSTGPACWSCAATLQPWSPFCVGCGKLQPAVAADSFQIFGLPRRLELDLAELERTFHQLSRRLHPDRFARASALEQSWSLAHTSLVNDGYRALKDPIRRTEYLLRLEGVELGEEHAGKSKKADRQPPADLLEEVFDLNMQLEEMRRNRKLGEEDPALERDLAQAKERFDGLLAEVDRDLRAQWLRWDSGLAAEQDAAKAAMAALLDRRRYLNNLVRDVNQVLLNQPTGA